jgi:hypothetical protein
MAAFLRPLALALLVVVAAGCSALAARNLTDGQKREAQLWAANNSLFTLYHEVTHLLIDKLGLPVLGREEDAADAVATYRLLSAHDRADDRAIEDAAYGWLLYGRLYGDKLSDSDFYNEHSLDKQRAYQIVCYMVGSNADAFRDIADKFQIDGDRQESCTYDWQRLRGSVENLLAPYEDKNHGKTDVRVIYDTAPAGMRSAADAFRRSGVFEKVAREVERGYPLRDRVTFRARSCGEPNAFYDSDAVEVIFCYELMDDFLSIIADDMPELRAAPASGLGRAGSGS